MAEILQQGENYEENDNGPEKDLTPNNNNKNKIAMIAIAGVVIAVFAILLIIVVMRKTTPSDANVDIDTDISDDMGDNSDFWSDADSDTGDDDFFEDFDASVDVQPEAPVDSSERTELRKYGYSNDEIEYAATMGIASEQLIADAIKLQEETAEEFVKEAGKKGSKAYKKLLRDTWLGGDVLSVPDVVTDDIQYLEQITINCDYKKIEPHGSQLWLKCNCKEYGNVFLNIDCKRWNQLEDKGNIVVCLSVEDYYGTKVVVDVVELDAGDRPAVDGGSSDDDFWGDAD